MVSKIIKRLAFFLVTFSPSVLSEVTNIDFHAKLIQSPCTLDESSKNLVIDFGDIMTADVDALALNAVIQENKFNLTVNCPIGISYIDASLTTDAPLSSDSFMILNQISDGAKGLGVRVYYKNTSDTFNTGFYWRIPVIPGENTLPFSGRLIKASDKISLGSSGDFSTSASISLLYN